MTKAELVSITGSPLADGWSYIYSNSTQNLTLVLSIKGSNAKNIGHEVIDWLHGARIENASQLHNLLLDILSRLREINARPQIAALWLPQNLNDPTSTAQNNKSQQNSSVSETQSSQPTMTLAAFQGKVLLKRNQKIGAVVRSDNDLRFIQGTVHNNDELILMTQQASQIEQSLRQLFKQAITHNEIKVQLKKKIEMLVDSSLTAMALTKLKYQPVTTSSTAHRPFLFSSGKRMQPMVEKNVDDAEDTAFAQSSTQTVQNEALAEKSSAPKTEKDDQPQQQDQLATKTPQKEDLKIKIDTEKIKKITGNAGKGIISAGRKVASHALPVLKNLGKKISTFIKSKKKADSLSEQNLEKTTADDNSSFEPAGDDRPTSKKKLNFSRRSTETIFKSKLNFSKLLTFPFKKAVYLEKNKSQKSIKIFSILLIAILIIAGSAWYLRSLYQKQQQQAQDALAPAQQLLQNAHDVMDQDIILARDQTAEAITLITQEKKEHADHRFTRNYFEEELQKAHIFFEEISGMIEVSQLEIFFNLREQAPNFITSSVDINSAGIFFLDKELKQVLALSLLNKQLNLINTQDIKPKDIAAAQDQIFLLGEGIHNFSLNELDEAGATTNFQELKNEGDSDREAIMMDFFEGYLYVFNPERRNIFRFIVRSDGLSEPIGWLVNKQGIKFDQIASMTVDGFIWLADNSGQIIKLERGAPVEFSVSGLEEPFGGSIKLFADADTEYLYVLEPGKDRLVVLSTDGDFIKQITHPSLASTTHFAVNEELGLGFAVSGSIVYEVPVE